MSGSGLRVYLRPKRLDDPSAFYVADGSLTFQSSPVVQPAGYFRCRVDCLSDAFGFARLHHVMQVAIMFAPIVVDSFLSQAKPVRRLDLQEFGSPQPTPTAPPERRLQPGLAAPVLSDTVLRD